MYSLVFSSNNSERQNTSRQARKFQFGFPKAKRSREKKKTEPEKFIKTYTVISSKNSHQTSPFDMKYTRKERKRNIKNSSCF